MVFCSMIFLCRHLNICFFFSFSFLFQHVFESSDNFSYSVSLLDLIVMRFMFFNNSYEKLPRCVASDKRNYPRFLTNFPLFNNNKRYERLFSIFFCFYFLGSLWNASTKFIVFRSIFIGQKIDQLGIFWFELFGHAQTKFSVCSQIVIGSLQFPTLKIISFLFCCLVRLSMNNLSLIKSTIECAMMWHMTRWSSANGHLSFYKNNNNKWIAINWYTFFEYKNFRHKISTWVKHLRADCIDRFTATTTECHLGWTSIIVSVYCYWNIFGNNLSFSMNCTSITIVDHCVFAKKNIFFLFHFIEMYIRFDPTDVCHRTIETIGKFHRFQFVCI